MEEKTVKTITITEEDFDRAIMENMVNNLQNPRFKERPEAATLYAVGGVGFAKEVKNILFGKEEHNE